MQTVTTARAGRPLLGALALSAALLLSACTTLLDAHDPDIVTGATSASGAIALKNGVIARFATFTAGSSQPDAIFLFGGLLADEWRSGDSFEERNSVDSRTTLVTNDFLAGPLLTMHRVRNEGQKAIDALRAFAPAPASNIALMFALTAFAENQLGETYCNGIPFSSLNGADIVFGDPVSVDSAFRRATNSADSALANNGGDDADRIGQLAAVVKGRALLNRGEFAAAATAVAAVPTDFVYQATYSLTSGDNQTWALNTSAARYVVADREGTNGLDFVSANDPRVPTEDQGRNAFDSQTPLFTTSLWERDDPVTVASGIEARLIEAEAALHAGGTALFLAKLNEARGTVGGLAPLADPGTAAGRADLLFRERAFWMFGTGHRLGDLRRLIRQYGRAAESVFPTGSFPKGGSYGVDVNLPISFDELNNPKIPQTPDSQTKSTCINRNA